MKFYWFSILYHHSIANLCMPHREFEFVENFEEPGEEQLYDWPILHLSVFHPFSWIEQIL